MKSSVILFLTPRANHAEMPADGIKALKRKKDVLYATVHGT